MKIFVDFLVALGTPPIMTWSWACVYQLVWKWPARRLFLPTWILTAICDAIFGGAFSHAWAYVIGSLISMMIALAIWWWRRKKRRNIFAVLGNKAKAARDALVRKAREVSQPRPVLRPV